MCVRTCEIGRRCVKKTHFNATTHLTLLRRHPLINTATASVTKTASATHKIDTFGFCLSAMTLICRCGCSCLLFSLPYFEATLKK